MKISKKLVVSSLSTAAALSFVAALSGTLAWFQYNTRVSTTVIGTGVAETGILQIRKQGGEWTRDLITADLIGERENKALITPVTFGKLEANDKLPDQAYKNPDASENAYATNLGSYDEVYEQADKEHDYIQYTVEFRAMDVENTGNGLKQVSVPVFLSNFLLENYVEAGAGSIIDGLRVHLAIDDEGDGAVNKNLLLSKNGVENLELFGALDLDGDEKADRKGGYEGNANRDKQVVYGNEGEYQTAKKASDLVATRVNDNYDEWDVSNMDKVLFHTSETGFSKVTVTLWFEGWDMDLDSQTIESNEIVYIPSYDVQPQNVEGYFIEDGHGDYEAATGKADPEKSYFSLHYRPLKLDVGAIIPADTYKLNGLNHEKVNLEVEKLAVDGTKYFTRIVKNETANIQFAKDVSAMFIKDGDNYLAVTVDDMDANHKALAGKTYYVKKSAGENAEVVTTELQDALGNWLPAGSKDVSKFYTQDANGNYIKASGNNLAHNEKTYYKFTSFGNIEVPTWSGENTDGAGFRFGMTFDVGKDAFNK
ncbi:MAG: hypothetical protein K5925_05180 [Bacilli bacterium]|nr:hypothetical protein [Bacilli bacterium]